MNTSKFLLVILIIMFMLSENDYFCAASLKFSFMPVGIDTKNSNLNVKNFFNQRVSTNLALGKKDIEAYSISGAIQKCNIISNNLLCGPITAMENLSGEEMPNIQKRTIIAGGLFIPTITTGFLLKNSTKPLNTLLFTGHKLTAVADLALINYTVYQRNNIKPLDGSEIAATIIMNLCFAGTIVSGALLSFDKPMPEFVHVLHNISPWLTIISSTVLMLLLGR